jgi:hypothetical protein
MEAPKRLNYPYLKLGIQALKGGFGSLQIFFIGRMPGDHNLLSLDASLAMPTRVLRFEASRHQRPGRSDRPPWAVRPARAI